ncbi:MAG: hypothetical protein HYT37_02910 [Candidatus Sungbacteria bacterium]|nr:hypothetical protein [Candidatus Sungbacteria bacterium]
MPDVLFWIIVIAIGVGSFSWSSAAYSAGPFFCGLIVAGFLIYIHYSGDSASVTTIAERATQAIPQGGVNMVSEGTFDFLAATGFWFWAVVVVALVSGFIFWMNDKENVAFSVLVFAGLILASMEMGVHGLGEFLWDNVWTIVKCALVFVFIGAPLTALLKWHLFGIDDGEAHLDEVGMMKDKYRHDEETLKRQLERLHHYKKPEARNNKIKIIGWMMYWPFYLVDTVLREFLWKMFKRMYLLLLPLFDRIANYNARLVQRELDAAMDKETDDKI